MENDNINTQSLEQLQKKDILPPVLGIILVIIILGIGVNFYFLRQSSIQQQSSPTPPKQTTPTSTNQLPTLSQTTTNNTKGIWRAFTTVTGDGIVVTYQYEIWKVNQNDGKTELLYKISPILKADESTIVDNIKASPDGKKLAIKISRNTNKVNGVITAGLTMIDIGSKNIEQVDTSTFQGEIPFTGASALLDYNWSPNSQELAYVLYKDSSSSIAKVYSLASKIKTELGEASSPIWINNNKDVIFSDKDGVVKVNVNTKVRSNIAIKLRQFPAVPPGEFQSAPALVPNSIKTIFLAVTENNEVFELTVDSMTIKTLGTSSEPIQKAGWSPNDKNIAVILRKDDKPTLVIFTSSETLSQAKTLDSDLGELVDHTYGITDDFVWSPDSNYLQFATRVYNLTNNIQVKDIAMEFCTGGGPHPAANEVIWSKSNQEVAYYPCTRTETDNWIIYSLNNGLKKVLEDWKVFGTLDSDRWFVYKGTSGEITILDNKGKPFLLNNK